MEKEIFEQKLEEINNYNEVVNFYRKIKFSLKKKKITEQDFKYFEQEIRERFFSNEKFDNYNTKVILKQVASYLKDIEEFKEDNLKLIEIGESFEESRCFDDVLCVYDENFVSIFGVEKEDSNNSKKYDLKKYMKPNYFETVKSKVDNSDAKIEQYGDYYVVKLENRCNVYKEVQITALVSLEKTAFDKMKVRLMSFFNKNIFSKNKYLPNMIEVYNSNKLKDYETDEQSLSKNKAKNRMKKVLIRDRICTREDLEKV